MITTSCTYAFARMHRLLLPAGLLLGVAQVHAGLIAHYKFDETSGTIAADSSGSGFHGALHYMTGTEWTTGKIGGALNFDGLVRSTGPLPGQKNYAYVYLPQILDIGGGGWWEDTSYTISFWAKIPVVGQGNLEPGEVVGKILSNNVGTPTMTVGVHSDGKILLTRTSQPTAYGSSDLRDNQWHHIAFVRGSANSSDSGFFYGYVDGVIDLTTSRGLHDTTLTKRHRIGMDYIETYAPSQKPFHGSLDDFRIYNHALSAGEVSALAGGGGGGAGGSAPEPASVFASLGLLTAAGCGLREWRRRS